MNWFVSRNRRNGDATEQRLWIWTTFAGYLNIKCDHENRGLPVSYGQTYRHFDAKPASPEGRELEVLGNLIDQYEKAHFAIERPTSAEAANFRKEQMNYN